MVEAQQRDDGLRDTRQDDGANERAGHGAGKGQVVVGLEEARVDGRHGCPVGEDVVGGLEVEGFLDLGVGGEEDVQKWKEVDCGCEQGVYERHGGICNEWVGTLDSNGVRFVLSRKKKKKKELHQIIMVPCDTSTSESDPYNCVFPLQPP